MLESDVSCIESHEDVTDVVTGFVNSNVIFELRLITKYAKCNSYLMIKRISERQIFSARVVPLDNDERNRHESRFKLENYFILGNGRFVALLLRTTKQFAMNVSAGEDAVTRTIRNLNYTLYVLLKTLSTARSRSLVQRVSERNGSKLGVS